MRQCVWNDQRKVLSLPAGTAPGEFNPSTLGDNV